MTDLFVSAFVTFFVVIDPPGCAPIFASLTTDASAAQRRAMAIRSVLIASAILIFFALLGEALLGALHISLDSFRIAGGLMLFLIALEMVFEKRQERRSNRAEEVKREGEAEDVSVFPMAMPMIAGPGSIASVMLLVSRGEGWASQAVVLGALAANLVLVLLALLAAGPIMRLVGKRIEGMVTRLLGVILAALAVQFVTDGVRAALGVTAGA